MDTGVAADWCSVQLAVESILNNSSEYEDVLIPLAQPDHIVRIQMCHTETWLVWLVTRVEAATASATTPTLQSEKHHLHNTAPVPLLHRHNASASNRARRRSAADQKSHEGLFKVRSRAKKARPWSSFITTFVLASGGDKKSTDQ